MRIIGGEFRGKILKVPSGLPVRPTTDFAKEGLFNILSNRFDFSSLRVLDLFSGTGHISLEFASRGCREIVAVDQNFKCVGFLKSISKELNLPISVVRSDVFQFLNTCSPGYDLIFADPPYDMADMKKLYEVIRTRTLLNKDGIFILEHGPKTKLDQEPGFDFHRKYGNVNFSFFREQEG